MIVYNVARRWFVDKRSAEVYRKGMGLKPDATLKVTVESRDDLAALLSALCDSGITPLPTVAPAALVDRAYVPVANSVPACVPDFLLRDRGIDPAKIDRSED